MYVRFVSSLFFSRRTIERTLLLLLLAVASTLLVVFTVRALWIKPSFSTKQIIATVLPSPLYVQRGRMGSKLGYALNILGDRLQRPGKERLILLGTLQRQNNPQAIPFRLFLELPRQMRLEEQGTQARVIVYDGSKSSVLGDSLSEADQDTIETIAFDSADGFFLGQMQGVATRALGTRFRFDNNKTTSYSGPFYDIYQVSDRINLGSVARIQPKQFYFNSDTLLLERVHYQIERNGKPIKVEVQINGWQQSNGQQFHTSITRMENGVSTLTIAITSATVTSRQNDGIFNLP